MSWKTPVPSPSPSPSEPSIRSAPSFAGAERLQVAVEVQRRTTRGAERRRARASSSSRCSWSRSCACSAAAARGQSVDQFVDVLAPSGKNAPCLAMKSSNISGCRCPRGAASERSVEVAEHRGDRFAVGFGGAFERLLHAGEPLVEHLAAEQLFDLAELDGPRRSATSSHQLADGGGRRRRQAVEVISARARSVSSSRASRASCFRSARTALSSSSLTSRSVPSRLFFWVSSTAALATGGRGRRARGACPPRRGTRGGPARASSRPSRLDRSRRAPRSGRPGEPRGSGPPV